MDLAGHKGAIHSLAWRDDSNVLASGSEDGSVKLWDVNSGKAIRSINAHGGGVTAVAFDHQGRLVTAGKDNRAKLWDANGKMIQQYQPVSEDVLEVAISHDGKRVIYGDWNGDVFNAQADKPDALAKLAANPPPIKTRIESIKTTLVSVQKELAPKKAAWDAAQKSLAAATGPLNALQAQIAAARKAATDADAASKASQQAVAAIDAELVTLTNQSRDLQDSLIASRVALKSAPQKLAEVAAAEESLAKHLTSLAAKRRARIASQADVGVKQKLATTKTAEADNLAKQIPALQKKVSDATSVVNAAKAAHDAIANRANAVQQKINRMQAELN